MPTPIAITVLLIWLTCPVVYTIAVGRHYAQRCQAELSAIRSCADEIQDLHDDIIDTVGPPTEPLPVLRPGNTTGTTTSRHRRTAGPRSPERGYAEGGNALPVSHRWGRVSG